jgi:hypothetical protein
MCLYAFEFFLVEIVQNNIEKKQNERAVGVRKTHQVSITGLATSNAADVHPRRRLFESLPVTSEMKTAATIIAEPTNKNTEELVK